MYTTSSRVYEILDSQFICRTRHSVHMMYTIPRSIFTILEIQFLYKSRHSLHIMYTISCCIYAILDIQFLLQIQTFRTDIMYTMSRRIFAVWTVNFLQIQTFRTYNVRNFPLNLRSFGNQFLFKSKHSISIMY